MGVYSNPDIIKTVIFRNCFLNAKKGVLLSALDARDSTNIEILAFLFGISRPRYIHPTVWIPGLCKPGPEIDQVVTNHVIHRILWYRDLEQ